MEGKNLVKTSLIEDLLDEKDFITEEEKDAPEYIDVNSLSEIIKVEPVSSTPEESFKCDKCPVKYHDVELLNIHSAKHSPDMTCPVCLEVFTSRKTLSQHIDAHIGLGTEDEKKPSYSCSYCTKMFSSRKSLIIHTRVHTNERPYKCKICGEGFKQHGTLASHHVTHTKEKKHVCEICNGAYTTSSSLRRHKKKIHDKQKTIDCKQCGAKFHNKTDFTKHLGDKHVRRPFKATCHLCSITFVSKRSYKAHKRQHSDLLPSRLLKTYSCRLCGEKLKTLKVFLEHQRTHLSYTQGEFEVAMELKSFRCKFCPTLCNCRNILFKHMAVHLEKSHKCDLCQKYYTFPYLKVHKMRVHGMPGDRVRHKVVPKEKE